MIDNYEKLRELCGNLLAGKNLGSVLHEERLGLELKEVYAQNEADYFLDLYDRKVKYAENPNNLLIPYLLGIVDVLDINKEPNFVQGDSPDIDCDYHPDVRDYLKNVWAPKAFGPDRVCNIGSYNTFGIKSTLQDMARVYGLDRDEIIGLTTKLGLKDEDGKLLTWAKALEMYPDLKVYCDANPDVAEGVAKLLHRNKSMGRHAGGLIVASIPLDSLVPMVKDKDNLPCSAWPEGLHGQALGPVGLIKFDMLVITALRQLAVTTRLIKERQGKPTDQGFVSCLPGQSDWTDLAYLDDPKALALAKKGDLKGVFQFDSEGIRKLAKDMQADSFNDLVAITALYRPGPLNMKMHERYAARKHGRESWERHPVLDPILDYTYGVMCYQEQVMQILNIVGKIPLKDCEIVRKAISKKKEELFGSYKVMFIENGQLVLGCNESRVIDLWNQMVSFAEYGFNLCLSVGTKVACVNADGVRVDKSIEDFVPGDLTLGVNEEGNTVPVTVLALHNNGVVPAYEVTFEDGSTVVCTLEHKFLTAGGQKSLWEIVGSNSLVLCDEIRTQGGFYAEEEGLDYSVRPYDNVSGEVLQAHQGVLRMSGSLERDWTMASPMRAGVWDKNAGGRTSADLHGMSSAGMENQRGGRRKGCCAAHCSVWPCIRNIPFVGGTSSHLRRMLLHQAGECQNQEYKDKPVRGTSQDRLCNGKKNFCSPRDSSRPGGGSSAMEGGESRKIRFQHGSSLAQSQAFKNGDMAEVAVGLGLFGCATSGQEEAGGFGEREHLDRGGRVLSFLRKEARTSDVATFGAFSEHRRMSERRGTKTTRDAASDQHGMLPQLDRGDEIGLVGHDTTYAPVSDTGRLVSRRIVRVVPVGSRQVYDLEVSCPTHNFLLGNGVITSNSHSVAYTYVSSRGLYLKANYPLEFFAALLSCESKQEKVKDYRLEAARFKIDVCPVDLNRSREKFAITDDKIYYGFSQIKGVGDAVAEKIVTGQPYDGLRDFLDRFGTSANTLKALCGLRIFGDDPLWAWRSAEWYKDETQKRDSSRKLFEKNMAKLAEALGQVVPDPAQAYYDDGMVDRLAPLYPEAAAEIKTLFRRWHRIVSRQATNREDRGLKPKWEDFYPEHIEVAEALAATFASREESEKAFYGFVWHHSLENSPDYKGGLTFEDGRVSERPVVMVECRVVSAVETLSKKGTTYWLAHVEDANGEVQAAQIWLDDWKRFGNDVKPGAYLRMKLKAPGDFKRYTLDGPPKHKRHLLSKTRELDFRVVVYRPPTKENHAKFNG